MKITLFKIFFLLATFFVLPSFASAYGAPDFLPDGAHPRLMLDAAELNRLAVKRDGGAAEWIDLQAWCDTHINDTGYDVQPTTIGYGGNIANGLANWNGTNYYAYRMSGFSEHLKNYALAYQVLKQPGSGQNLVKAATYAARARTLLIDGIAKSLNVGEEPNGLRAIRVADLADVSVNSAEVAALKATTESLPGQASLIGYKLGYASRFLSCVPLSYDWIYETLSQNDKDILSSMMLRWYDWIQGKRSAYNNGVLINGIRYYEDFGGVADATNVNPANGGAGTQGYAYLKMYNNFEGGHESLMSLIPVVLYGDNADIPSYMSETKNRLITGVGELENDLSQSGGESVEGWNYGSGYMYLMPSLYAYYTGTGDTLISSMTWPAGLVNAMLHRLQGNLLNVPYWGYWTGTPMGVNRITFAIPFVGALQRLDPNLNLSKVGQYMIKNFSWQDAFDRFDKMFWLRSDIGELSPATLPLSYLAKGGGIFTSRSSWSDPNTVHLLTIMKGMAAQADHEGYSQGHFSLARGADKLLEHSNAAGDSPPAVSFNTVVFNNANSQSTNPILTKPAIDRIEQVNASYSYVSGDITNAYKRAWNPDSALLFRRSILHLLPGFIVVSDATRSNPALGNLKDWYTQYTVNPANDGISTISAITGSSKVFVKTLFPSGGSFTTTNPYTGSYRVKYTPAVTQEYDQFLHVIEATGSVDSQTTSTLITGTGGRGALIENPTENIIAMFTDDQSGADIASLTYDATTSAPVKNIITSLTPNKNYNIQINGGSAVVQAATAAGIIEFTNVAGTYHYSITSSAPDMIAPNAPSGLSVL
jgi:hypothetical protein